MPDFARFGNTGEQRSVCIELAECIELADSSFDPAIEAHYRSLAGRYIKVARRLDSSFIAGTAVVARRLKKRDRCP
jgi:hypothetical protein